MDKTSDMNKKIEVICTDCMEKRIIVTSKAIKERKCRSCSKKVDKNIITFFDNIDDPDKAYIFGFLWADGWLNKTNVRIELKLADLDALKFMQEKIGSGALRFRTRIDNRFKKSSNTVTLDISSTYLSRKLVEIGFRQSINCIPEEFHLDFLRGYIDGDGHIGAYLKGRKLSISFSSNKEENWNHITSILNKYNVKYTLDRAICYSSLRILGSDDFKINLLKRIYNTGSFFLSRKIEPLYEYIKGRISRKKINL